jgi:hypothetical protein
MGDDVDATDERLTGGRNDSCGEHAGGGGFAGAIGAEQPEDLASVDGKIQGVNSLEIGSCVDLGQIDGADDLVVVGRWRSGGGYLLIIELGWCGGHLPPLRNGPGCG